MQILPPKDIDELIPVTFDFSAVVVAGSMVTPQTVSISVYLGNDANPGALLYGAPQVDGPRVVQWITGGVAGTQYKLRCKVSSSDGQVLVLSARLPVRVF